ncbi:MFS transporter small subunit, partial [Pseudomonas monteilii]
APAPLPLVLLAWAVVVVPLAWGVWVTLQKTAVLFH